MIKNQKDKNIHSKFASLFTIGKAELVVTVLLIALILATLNYFSLIPLSETFPSFSFLPKLKTQQKKSPPSKAITQKAPTIQYLVAPNNPKTFSNNEDQYVYNPLENSSIRVMGPVRIDIEMTVSKLTEAKENASTSSSLMFDNGLYQSLNKDYRFLRLFYSAPHKNWALEYYYGGRSKFLPLLSVGSGEIYGKFILSISSDGKNVKITLPTGEQKALDLPDSLYTATNKMRSMIQVAPFSQITLHSLSYQYSFIISNK